MEKIEDMRELTTISSLLLLAHKQKFCYPMEFSTLLENGV
jgi:hypothetical protein